MKMTNNLYSLVLLICIGFFLVCCNACQNETDSNKEKIIFYYRDIGDNNGYKTYGDYLVVDNYSNGSMTIKQFADIAKKYIDTVKAELPVSSVTFIGRKPGVRLPKGNWDSYMVQKKYYVIGIDFTNSLLVYSKKKPEINIIWISNNKHWKMYSGSSEIDSLLSVKKTLDTGL